MNSHQSKQEPAAEYAEAFLIAKEALGLVGKFRTPPTPKVYEVWYRYVEGKHETIRDQLSHAVNQTESVSLELLEHLHDQFCVHGDGVNARISLELSNEMADLRFLISSQLSAGDDLNTSINAASETLSTTADASSEIRDCVAELLASNKNMQSQLHETSTRSAGITTSNRGTTR